MVKKHRIPVGVIIILAVLSLLLSRGWLHEYENIATAQEDVANLLRNGELETPYYLQANPKLYVPAGWQIWPGQRPFEAYPDSSLTVNSTTAWKLTQHDAPFTIAAYQQVDSIEPGSVLHARASGFAYACTDSVSRCRINAAPYVQSDINAGIGLKIGIDPSGGLDPLADAVVWSDTFAPIDQWGEVGVSALAQDAAVTVFLHAAQTGAPALSEVFWDAVSLTLGDDIAQVPYASRVAQTAADALVGYWPLTQQTIDGVTVGALRNSALNGTARGVSWEQPGITSVDMAARFEGRSSIDLYSVALRDGFPASGTLMLWARVGTPEVWESGIWSRLAEFVLGPADDRLYIGLNANEPGALVAEYRVNGDRLFGALQADRTTDWFHTAVVWGPETFALYLNGELVVSKSRVVEAWTGTLQQAVLGANGKQSAQFFEGWLAHVALWDTMLSAEQIEPLAQP